MAWVRFLEIIQAAVILVALYAPTSSTAQISLNVTGSIEPALSTRVPNCAPDDYPDAPLRAFREPNGRVRAFAPHYQNFLLEGDKFQQLDSYMY